MAEHILVVKTEKLAPWIAGKNGLITGSDAEILSTVMSEYQFVPRPEAEEDPGYKQIIPYVVLLRGDETFLLRRLKKGNEKRLHGMLSLGVGGHINPADGDGKDVLMQGLRREVDEEVAVEKELGLTPRGVINDDSNGVGSVHLGFFFTMRVAGDVTVRESEKLAGEWVRIEDLKNYRDDMETWSQIILEAL
jgi:predicted NUDIX family phosphoesterase